MAHQWDLNITDNDLRCLWAAGLIHDQRINNWSFSEFPQIDVTRAKDTLTVTLALTSQATVTAKIAAARAQDLVRRHQRQAPLPDDFLGMICDQVQALERTHRAKLAA